MLRRLFSRVRFQSSDTFPDREVLLKKIDVLTGELEKFKAIATQAQADAKIARHETDCVYDEFIGFNEEFDENEKAEIRKKLKEKREKYIRNLKS